MIPRGRKSSTERDHPKIDEEDSSHDLERDDDPAPRGLDSERLRRTVRYQVDLPSDVATALVQRGQDLGGHDALLLPTATRRDETFYLPEDLDALDHFARS